MNAGAAPLGLVLCGGLSQRMGRDKGLLLRQGRPWAAWALDRLGLHCTGLRLSLRRAQREAYLAWFPPALLLEDDPREAACGPLAGVRRAHACSPGQAVWALACDLPHMEAAPMEVLASAYRRHPGYEAYAFRVAGVLEPLCAIYRPAALVRLPQAREASLQALLHQARTLVLPCPPAMQPCFRNCNLPVALEGAG